MSSTDIQTVVIACPHCGTRYQVAQATLGPSGRAVQCAHCQKSWQASAIVAVAPKPAVTAPPAPLPPGARDDRLFDAAQEAALDRAFEAEAEARMGEPADAEAIAPQAADAADAAEQQRMLDEIRAALAPKLEPQADANIIDPAQHRSRKRAFEQRKDKFSRKLPLARIKRALRLVSLLFLAVIVGGGLLLRVDLVRQFPALAGLYASLGLPVNVIGLDFRNVQTLLSLSNGKNVMRVSAQIYSVSNGRVVVPPVLITLTNSSGQPIYEWSVTPLARDIEPGEVIDISSQVTSPPEGASRIRLSFTNARNQAEASPTGAPSASETN